MSDRSAAQRSHTAATGSTGSPVVSPAVPVLSGGPVSIGPVDVDGASGPVAVGSGKLVAVGAGASPVLVVAAVVVGPLAAVASLAAVAVESVLSAIPDPR
ncbi:hypothetical protein [Nannocystis pusilla]|uniref:Uncharacterized protein n=1 Tax=Nannocystis pusilla TaxID=889268 RepID=A0ABS7U0R7_9BACT|nr:hypothetical protein [Nannocystis pusilla]MBZ5714118.1 hypothetical protein [Nannocystis pusilla]